MTRLIQPAFARGELAPDLFGRVDIAMYYLGLKTARNATVQNYGGISNRVGTQFIGPVAVHANIPRLIQFEFKTTDTHVIEFGHHYIRIIRNDAHVTETAVNVSAASATNPVVITTSTPHGYSTSDEVFLSGIGGMTEITEKRFLIVVTGANTFELLDQVDGSNIDGTAYSAYTTGGTSARIYTLTTDYDQADLRTVKFTQSADIMTLTHPNYPPRELQRYALDSWALVDITFKPEHAEPAGALSVTIGAVGTTTMAYKITAINSDTNEESLAAQNTSATHTITGITNANPGVVTTSAAHGLTEGDEVLISGVVGMTEVNDRRFRVGNPSGSTFELRDTDTSGFTAYSSGGTVTECFVRVTTSNAFGSGLNNTVSWPVAANSRSYLVYRSESNGRFSFVGETESNTWLDTDALAPNTDESPPVEYNPFFGAGNYPRAVGSYEQRRVFGGKDNKPDTSNFSKVGAFSNYTHSFPLNQADAIEATLPASKVNEIRHYVTVNDLVVFTSGSEWSIGSGDNVAFAFDTAKQKPQSNWGSSELPPIVAGNTILFVQEVGAMIRSLGYTFDINGYKSNNLSLMVPHLLRGHELLEWGYARFPNPVIYIVRDDGELLVLTFDEEQKVVAWTHWDTTGFFESVAVIRPSVTDKDDQAYFVVNRNINGRSVRYIERTRSRTLDSIKDAFFVDCGLTYDVPLAIENITTPAEGASLLLDGVGDYVSVPDANDWTYSDEFTVHCWFKYPTIPTADVLVAHHESSTDNRSWALQIDGSGFLTFVMWADGTAATPHQVNSGVQPSANVWHHVAFVRDASGNGSLYLDGVLVAGPTAIPVAFNAATSLAIGSVNPDSTPTSFFTGHIEQVEILNGKALWTANFTPPTAPGPIYPEHVLYVPFNGADAATSAIDLSSRAHALAFVGDAQLDTADFKFSSGNTPVEITITGHGLVDGDYVDLSDIVWQFTYDEFFNEIDPNDLNDMRFTVVNATANTFQLRSIDTGLVVDGANLSTYLRSGYARKAVLTLSGLEHLASTPVVMLADGNVISSLTVSSNGTVTLPQRFSRIHVGLRYITDLETLNPEAPKSTIQGAWKKVNEVILRFEKTRGLLIGPNTGELTEMKQREFELMGDPTDMVTGDMRIPIEGDWNTNGRIFMRQKDPLPLTLLAAIPDITLEDNVD